MDLERKFYALVEEWKEHCKNPRAEITDCDAYTKIKGMGRAALPFIENFYQSIGKLRKHGVSENLGCYVVATFGLPSIVEEIENRTTKKSDCLHYR